MKAKSVFIKTTLISAFILLLLFIIYSILSFWPTGGEGVRFFGYDNSKLDTELRLIILVSLSGVLGSFVHTATSIVDYIGNNRFKMSWVAWYIMRPFIGMALALIFYFVIRGGFFPSSGSTSGETQEIPVNIFGLLALGCLAGMFSKQAADKLREVFDNLFRTQDPTERMESLKAANPSISSISKTGGDDTDQTFELKGNNLASDLILIINGKPSEFEFVDKETLNFEYSLTDDDKSKGAIDIVLSDDTSNFHTDPYTFNLE